MRKQVNMRKHIENQKGEIAAKGGEEEMRSSGRAMLAPTMLRFSAEVIYRAFV